MKKVVQLCLSAAAFLLLSRPCAAQEIVWGGGVGFGNAKIRHGMASMPDGVLKFEHQTLNVKSNNRDIASVVRAFRLADGRSVVYKLAVKRLENVARFEVLLQAYEPTPEQVEKWRIDPARVENGFLSKYTQPIMLDDGDIISVDVLVEPRTGAKLIDYFQIFTGEPITRRNPDKLKAEARALTLEDLILTVDNYEVRRNGEKLKSSGGGASGRYIWLDIPHVGRAIFTLATPPEGSGFQQTAIVNGQQLVFWIDSVQYEWLSKSKIVTADGSFRVWMKFDPTPSLPPNLPPEVLERIRSGWSVGASDKSPTEKRKED
jgi:hypothetical protein